MMSREEGRLVWNHSTHLQGLVPKLKKLCKQPGIHTVTPAVLGRARSHAPKLLLKVSVPIRGGYKLIARNGKSYQEVFVVTSLDKGGLESAIAQSLG